MFNLTDTNLLAGRNFTSESASAIPERELDVVDIAENSSGLKVGHGTAVAAIIGARDSEPNNNFGNTFWQVGVLPFDNVSSSGAEILPVKVCDKTTKCKGIDVIKGICYAISQKSDVINLSLSTQQPSNIVKQAIQAATDAGVVVVASVGNRGTVPQYPAAYSLELPIIAVGSVRYDPSGKYKTSSFSVPGAWVSLVAPGETQSASYDASHATGFGYRSFEGTSFAAPWVSGVAAMLKAINPSATPLEIKNKIIAGATRTNLECLPLEKCGAGLLNAANAIGAP
jgi:subtilisin family serine protease